MDVFLVFPARLRDDKLRFISIPSLNFPEMRPFRHFLVNFSSYMETTTVTKLVT